MAADQAAGAFCQQVQGWVQKACQAHRRLSRARRRGKAAKAAGEKLRSELEKICGEPLRYG